MLSRPVSPLGANVPWPSLAHLRRSQKWCFTTSRPRWSTHHRAPFGGFDPAAQTAVGIYQHCGNARYALCRAARRPGSLPGSGRSPVLRSAQGVSGVRRPAHSPVLNPGRVSITFGIRRLSSGNLRIIRFFLLLTAVLELSLICRFSWGLAESFLGKQTGNAELP